ncbi:MAG: LysR family transcriptional regulator [Limisphaerales bacterium]
MVNAIHTSKNPLDSRQLNAFASLARTGSFAGTARELFLTNSAISHSIRALETEVGCRLLIRMGKKTRLTEEGEAFLHYATLGLEAFAKARESVAEFKRRGCRRLRVGAGAAMCRLLLPRILADMRQEDPHFLLNALVVQPWEMSASLEKGDLDFILGEPPGKLPQIEFTHLFDSSLRVVVSSCHRWAAQGRLIASEMADEPCLLTNKSHPTRRLIEDYYSAEKIRMNGVAEIDSFDTIKELVRQGFGMTILPDWAVKEELAAGVLVAFAPGRKRLTQSWGLLRWPGRPLSAVESRFRLSCISIAKTLGT